MDETASPTTITSEVTPVPEEIKGWSWGGFLWSWIWAIGNDTWIGLLALIIPWPIMQIVLGIKGREWAWKNKQWSSVEDFKRVQRSWVKWWFIIIVPLTILSFIGITLATILALNPSKQYREAQEVEMQQNLQFDQQVEEMYTE